MLSLRSRGGARRVQAVLWQARRGKQGQAKEQGKYSSTVILPTTSFSQRANAAQREPELQQFWAEQRVFERVNEGNQNGSYVLHDGPPYANGDLHIGHALNKILKDFIVKYNLLQGKRVSFIPGWDCHGLPIELKVLQNLKSKEKKNISAISLRSKANDLASNTITKQSESFQRYGVWGDWKSPYATLHPSYEAQQIKVFGQMVRKGFVYRGKKPVHWSPSSHTALAEAELEYPAKHVSTSIYVGFQVLTPSTRLSEIIHEKDLEISTCQLKIAIWTTTPWTLPANQAAAVNPNMTYCIISHPDILNSTHFLVAKDLVPNFADILSKSDFVKEKGETLVLSITGELTGSELVGTVYRHPVYPDQQQRIVIGGSYVTSDAGTGLVHTAPGHGMDDFVTGQRENLKLVSPVDDYGRFTEEAGEALFKMDVLKEGNRAVIEMIKESGCLLHLEEYSHKYPYDWRTGKPTITRTTEQWFASVEAFRDDVMNQIKEVTWLPSIGEKRISSMVKDRKDWCISRQRSWGVPIPAFYHIESKEVLMTDETIDHVEQIFRKHGSDAWWTHDTADLLPPGLRHLASSYVRGSDTMDVWFDSGTSWAGVLQERQVDKYDLFPADLYLEGSDQHRGWFQSSLLTSVAVCGVAPYKSVLTHGFVLDEKGFKMSKSLGNVIDPNIVINGGKNKKTHPAYGADTLRLWVAGVDYTSDVSIGDSIVKQVSDSYRKLRNTLRFLLGSISDFNPNVDSVALEKLPSLDKFMLGKLSEVFHKVDESFASYQFYKASNLISHFTTNLLSNFYLDISKDRLYINGHDDIRRRSCQTVLHHIFEQLVSMMAPLVPHMAEDAYQSLPHIAKSSSVFERGWISNQLKFSDHEAQRWNFMMNLRNDVNQCIELARRDKYVGASQECAVFLYFAENIPNVDKIVEELLSMTSDEDAFISPQNEDFVGSVDDLRFILLVSQVHILKSMNELVDLCPNYHLPSSDAGESTKTGAAIGVRKAKGLKCNRCWYYSGSVVDNNDNVLQNKDDQSDLCSRCAHILNSSVSEGL